MNGTQLAGSWMLRSIPAFAAADPFDGNLLTWVGDPDNTWFYASWIVIAVMAIGVIVMAKTSIYFAETQKALFGVTCLTYAGLIYIAAEGGKFDPTNLQHDTTAVLFFIALTSAVGVWIAKAKEKEAKA